MKQSDYTKLCQVYNTLTTISVRGEEDSLGMGGCLSALREIISHNANSIEPDHVDPKPEANK